MSQSAGSFGHISTTNYLEAVSVDVRALEREFIVTVRPWDLGTRFVPLYQVVWSRGQKPPEDVAATVEVLLPERLLVSLAVQKSDYLKREPLIVPNKLRAKYTLSKNDLNTNAA